MREEDERLLSAAKDDDAEGVKGWLKHGAGVDARDDDGETALMWAAKLGNLKVARELIEGGAGLEERNQEGETALHLAAWRGSANVIEDLARAGADVNAKEATGWTPLMVAAAENKREALLALLKGGARLEERTEDQEETALILAALMGSDECMSDLLAAGADLEAIDAAGKTAEDWASPGEGKDQLAAERERRRMGKEVGASESQGKRLGL